MQNNGFYTNISLNLRGHLLDLRTPKVMGILNVTPDSFYDGGRLPDEESLLLQAKTMIDEGAALLDIGGYSTRPGAADISEAEESGRVVPAIRAIVKNFTTTPVSVDTFRSGVARTAVEAGASMVNDISGGSLDPNMFETIADLKVPYVLMHMRGNPQTMSKQTQYENLVKEMALYFSKKLEALLRLGVKDIILDPGFGFAKTADQNFEILQHLDYFKIFRLPILAGLSRKSMIWKTLQTDPSNALNGTTALNMMALSKGASMLRVHDVKEAVESVILSQQMLKQKVSL